MKAITKTYLSVAGDVLAECGCYDVVTTGNEVYFNRQLFPKKRLELYSRIDNSDSRVYIIDEKHEVAEPIMNIDKTDDGNIIVIYGATHNWSIKFPKKKLSKDEIDSIFSRDDATKFVSLAWLANDFGISFCMGGDEDNIIRSDDIIDSCNSLVSYIFASNRFKAEMNQVDDDLNRSNNEIFEISKKERAMKVCLVLCAVIELALTAVCISCYNITADAGFYTVLSTGGAAVAVPVVMLILFLLLSRLENKKKERLYDRNISDERRKDLEGLLLQIRSDFNRV